ncbi:hypothetical protein [Providencia alcalifaciens]|uniref:tail fiber/spike domain-containing protein n=1 Tax=Providencia alcalifaciens TaxID=126385 RepID=UPI00044A08C4|nr:hypothetical protein [Providencia alcalifaciens]ETT05287.1 hypothetical protein HMPREF1562_1320 [Providencia alcalifaciens F90-2004]EUC94613.1 hypothetical protein HMPREF1567_0954 [Providencia alcalifaciens PAL-2]
MREVKPTQKPVPSSDIKDLFFNSGLLDIWATSLERKYIDRFGNCHLTAAGMEWIFNELVTKFKIESEQALLAAGYVPAGAFQEGAGVVSRNGTVLWKLPDGDGDYYRWDGDLPKQVPAGSTPQSTGGIGKGAWVSVGDASLRSDIIDVKLISKNDIAYYITDNHIYQDAIASCEKWCKENNQKMIIHGEYVANEKLEWDVDTDGSMGTIKTDHGVRYGGKTSVQLHRRIAVLPSIVPLNPSLEANVYKDGVGIEIANIIDGHITIPMLGEENGGWQVGVHIHGDHAGCAWNEIVFVKSHNNRIGCKVTRTGKLGDEMGTGFANQNLIKLMHMYKKPHAVGGSPDLGGMHIYCEETDSNTFLCPAIELDTFTGRPGLITLAYFKNCSDNQMLRAHTESPIGSKIVFDGAACQNNYIEPDGASSGNTLIIEEISGAKYNIVERGRWGLSRTIHKPIVYSHGFDLDRAVIEILDPFTDVQNRDGYNANAEYCTRLFAGRAFYKNKVDNYPRIDINGRGGYLRLGNGTYQPVKQYPVLTQEFNIFANDDYISPLNPKHVYLDEGRSLIDITFVMTSLDGSGLSSTGSTKAMVSYTKGQDYVVLKSHCNVESSTFDTGSADVRVTSFSGASNILQIRVKAKKDGQRDKSVYVMATIRVSRVE